MLKNVPNILSPELLKTLDEMGHGDCICIGAVSYTHLTLPTNSRV